MEKEEKISESKAENFTLDVDAEIFESKEKKVENIDKEETEGKKLILIFKKNLRRRKD